MDNEENTVASQRIVSTRALEAEVTPTWDKHGGLQIAIVIGKAGSEPGKLAADELFELPELTFKLTEAVLNILDTADDGGLTNPDLYNLLSLMAERISAYRDPRVRIGNDRIA